MAPQCRPVAAGRCKSWNLCSPNTKVTACRVAALQKALPNCKIEWDDPAKAFTTAKLAYLDPAFQQWVKTVAAMPAEKQIEAVSKKLMELNPGFDGKVTVLTGKARPRSRRRGDGDWVCHGQRDGYFAGAGVGGIEFSEL